jgi:hypothetical protein
MTVRRNLEANSVAGAIERMELRVIQSLIPNTSSLGMIGVDVAHFDSLTLRPYKWKPGRPFSTRAGSLGGHPSRLKHNLDLKLPCGPGERVVVRQEHAVKVPEAWRMISAPSAGSERFSLG